MKNNGLHANNKLILYSKAAHFEVGRALSIYLEVRERNDAELEGNPPVAGSCKMTKPLSYWNRLFQKLLKFLPRFTWCLSRMRLSCNLFLFIYRYFNQWETSAHQFEAHFCKLKEGYLPHKESWTADKILLASNCEILSPWTESKPLCMYSVLVLFLFSRY